ncbi:hypothetical protein ACOMHN_062576 [Nucella lapillus]
MSELGNQPMSRLRTSKCLWRALQKVQTICQYVFLKHQLYPVITMPCDQCCDLNLKKALDRALCFHYNYYVTLASKRDMYGCRTHKKPVISIMEKCGPEITTVVPFHNFPWLQATNKRREELFAETHYRPPDPVRPCFLCEEGTELLCRNCYLCNQCVQRLVKYEKSIRPGFIRSSFLESSSFWVVDDSGPVGSGVESRLRYRGSLLSMKKDQTVTLTEPMTPVYFNCLGLSVFRGYDYYVQGLLVNGKTVKFKGLSGSFIDEDEKEQSNCSYMCREGAHLQVKLCFSKVPGRSVLTFHLNGLKIIEHEVEGCEVLLSIVKKVAGSCVIQATGVKNAWQLCGGKTPEAWNTVERLSATDPGKVSVAMFTANRDKYMAVTSSGENLIVCYRFVYCSDLLRREPDCVIALCIAVTSSGENLQTNKDVLIRPIGYAELKGLEVIRDVELTPTPPAMKSPMFLHKFSQHQVYDCLEEMLKAIKDPEDLIAHCRLPASPATYFASMERQRQKVEEALFQNGHVDYTDSAMMLLPQNLTAQDLRTGNIPSHIMSSGWKAHPLCYVRGDANSVMTVLPTYNLPTQVECFRLVHMIDNPGFPFTAEQSELRPFFWAWIMMVLNLQKGHRWVDHPAAAVMEARVPGQWVDRPAAMVMEAREQGRCWIDHPAAAVMEARVQGRHWVDRPSEGLSSYSNMLEGVPGLESLSTQEIWRGLKEALWKMAFLLYLGSDSHVYLFFSFEEIKGIVATVRKMVEEQVSPDPQKYGLEAMPMLFTENKIHMCPSHAHAGKPGKGITQVPQEIFTHYPYFIYSLLLADNQIAELPGSMFSALRNLKDLDLSTNQLTALPEEVGLCAQMETLSVVTNRLSCLPDSLANCKRLGRLDISHNHFTKFPEVITKLTELRRLYAQNLQLTRLPEGVGELRKLRKLYLNGNCFVALPASLSRLQSLQDLSLSGVPWCKIRPNQLLSKQHFEQMLESANLTRWLDLHDRDKTSLFQQFDEDANGTLDQKEIGKVNANIFHLFPRLGYMGSDPPDDETPSGFPLEIMELKSLEYLSLQYQGLVSIPMEMGRLENLQTFNVSHNPNLLSVSEHCARLPLKRLEMEDCPVLKTPPKEIRAKGFKSTFAFLKRLLSGSVDCKRTKIMMVGLGGAGKTSLVKALMSDKGQAEMAVGEEITDGIDICPWTVDTEEGPLTFSIWDFAGQTVYYNTHQFFLSDRAVYLLLWNIRLGFEHAGLDFWLSSISVHAPKAPIFVVGTHVDQVSKVELPMREMKQRYNQIADFHFVSSFSGQGMQELREQMIEVTLQQQYMGEKIPGVWLGFEDNLKMITDRSVIPYTELEKIANQSGIFEASEVVQAVHFLHELGSVVQAVQFLHELGSLQHFTNDFLKDQVVINPQWIVDVMACVVSVKDSAIKDGRLRHQDIGLVWKDYPESLHSWLLRLTEEYDLTFPLKDVEVNLVPCLLTEKEPEFEWPEVEKGSGLMETKMTYKFDYLPAGLFNRGQVRLHEFSDSSLVWKRGSYLRKNGHLCLVRQTRDSELVVRAQGPRPENILFLVHEVFEGLILESFQGVTYDYLIPCPECLRLYLKGPHMFAASVVRRAVELKAPFLQCLKYFHTISIVDLQACMPPEGTVDFDLHLVQAVRGLRELQRDLAADIFVSFCKKDENGDKPGAITPAKILTDVEKLGYKSWVASNASQYSMDEMAKALMDAPLFVAFMTNSYVSDEDCCNLFKYARLTLRKPILLVTICTGYEWRQSKLGILMSDQVYINMQQPERYPSKLDELKGALTDRLKKKTEEGGSRDSPPCFISYCWQNSAQAVALGSRSVEGAAGFGDPRDIKNHLAEKGIECWIDVERVGVHGLFENISEGMINAKHGLFEDIGEGLVNAKVVLVCVSDAYASSSNCVVEFRFFANTLKLPMILAVVGSGSKWRATEVGVLSQHCPVVSFQESQSPAVYERLVQLIQPYMTSDPEGKVAERNKAFSKDQKSHSFQELCELAQRKFLRQVVVYTEVQDTLLYPRLLLLDLPKVEDKAATDEKDVAKGGESEGEGKEETDGKKYLSGSDFHHVQFVVSFLCEHDEGWHVSGEPQVMDPEFSTAIEEYAPFLSRISAIAKYSKKLALNCMTQPLGKMYLQWLEKSPQIAEVTDFQQSYHKLRQTVADADEGKVMGNLARCHLPNGRMVWLCEKHRQNNRVTILSDSDTVSSSHHATETIGVDYFLQALREMSSPEPGRLELRSEFRVSAATPLPSTPEDSVVTTTHQPPDGAPSSSKVKDTSGDAVAGRPLQVSKRSSKSRIKSSSQTTAAPERSLHRQPSQLQFPKNKSRACALM